MIGIYKNYDKIMVINALTYISNLENISHDPRHKKEPKIYRKYLENVIESIKNVLKISKLLKLSKIYYTKKNKKKIY